MMGWTKLQVSVVSVLQYLGHGDESGICMARTNHHNIHPNGSCMGRGLIGKNWLMLMLGNEQRTTSKYEIIGFSGAKSGGSNWWPFCCHVTLPRPLTSILEIYSHPSA
jgi:hypothetical protein